MKISTVGAHRSSNDISNLPVSQETKDAFRKNAIDTLDDVCVIIENGRLWQYRNYYHIDEQSMKVIVEFLKKGFHIKDPNG